MKSIKHNIQRAKLCTYALDEQTACSVAFVGLPAQRYCAEHTQAHRERLKRIWRKRTALRSRQGVTR